MSSEKLPHTFMSRAGVLEWMHENEMIKKYLLLTEFEGTGYKLKGKNKDP